ncbi:MAG: hypothetical protein SGI73_07890 [Chloroflexota bacterium]|nr:hypothetical protein [Chloroflexota bacterium]
MTQTRNIEQPQGATETPHLDVDSLLSVLMNDLTDADLDATKPPRAPSVIDTSTTPAVRSVHRRAAYIAPTSNVPERVRELFSMDTTEMKRATFGVDTDANDGTVDLSAKQPPFVVDTVSDEATLFEALSEREKRMQIEEKWLSEQRIRVYIEKMLLEEQARRLLLEERLVLEQSARLISERRVTALTQQITSEKERRAQAMQHLKALEDQLSS